MPVSVSIILPSLNVADYIEETLDSVKSQTLQNIEIICIDAGSTDGTWELIQNISSEDRRIKTFRSPVKSYGYQVNMGLKIAQGEYVAILETDDFVTSEMYEVLYLNAKRWNVDYVKCDYSAFHTDKEGNKILSHRKITINDKYYEKPFYPRCEFQMAIDDWYLWNGIYKHDFIINKGITLSETIGAAFQDIGFLHQVLSYSNSAIFLRNDMYRYRIDRNDASSKSNKTLLFIRQEYGRLFAKDWSDSFVNAMLYKRLTKSFIRACMDSSDDVFRTREGQEICEWFRNKMLYAHENSIVNTDELPFAMREVYIKLLKSVNAYVDDRGNRINNLKTILSNNIGIIIFGCGSYGIEVYNKLIENGYYIYAFMDNNKELWGKQIDGIDVISPQSAKIMSDDICYIIANEKDSGEIEKQLRSMKKNIKTYIYC